MKLQNEEIMLKTLKTLMNELNRTSPLVKNWNKVETLHVLQDKVALLTMRRSEWGARNSLQIIFIFSRFKPYIKKMLIKR